MNWHYVNLLMMSAMVVLITGCSSAPSKTAGLPPVVQEMEIGNIYEVHTRKGERKIIEVKAITSTEVVGLRQSVAVDDIESVEQEISDPPKSAVQAVATTVYVAALTVAVLLILILL